MLMLPAVHGIHGTGFLWAGARAPGLLLVLDDGAQTVLGGAGRVSGGLGAVRALDPAGAGVPVRGDAERRAMVLSPG
ncbi:hypothetical protein GCM10009696_09640 [Kocuria himachalensis]